MNELISPDKIYEALLDLRARPIDGQNLVASRLELPGIYLAIDGEENIRILIQDDRGEIAPPRRLKYLSVDYGLHLEGVAGSERFRGRFISMKLTQNSDPMLRAFSTVLGLLFMQLREEFNVQDLRQLVEDFIELFRPRSGDPRERIKGLWGELACILYSDSPQLFAAAWHEQVNAKRDFTFARTYLEVKTTEGAIRKHEVGLNQLLSSSEGKVVYLASVLVEEDQTGITIFDLLSGILESGLDSASQQRVVKLFIDTVGLDTDEARELRFRVQFGLEQGLWIFKADNLPRPLESDSGIESAVSNTRFTLNLEIVKAFGVTEMSLSDFSSNLAS